MNILTTQLDHIGHYIGEIQCTESSGGLGSEYYAKGYVVFNFDGLRISIEIQWVATLTLTTVKKSTDGFSAEFIPRIELTECSIENFPWHNQVGDKELESWLNEFKDSCRIYDDIVSCLPLPKPDEMEIEDCLSDRRFWRGDEE